MNKSEHRHQLIRALVTKNKIHTQAELQALLADNDIQVTQATLSRDIKSMNLSKVVTMSVLSSVKMQRLHKIALKS